MKIQGVTNLLANAANINVLAGSAFEFTKVDSVVRFWVVGDAAGAARATLQSGSDVLMEESPISRANRMPIWQDDLTAEDVAEGGDRLKIALRNTGGVAIDVFWACEIVPMSGG